MQESGKPREGLPCACFEELDGWRTTDTIGVGGLVDVRARVGGRDDFAYVPRVYVFFRFLTSSIEQFPDFVFHQLCA